MCDLKILSFKQILIEIYFFVNITIIFSIAIVLINLLMFIVFDYYSTV